MVQNAKQSEMAQNGLNGQKWSKTVQPAQKGPNSPKQSKMAQNSPNGPKWSGHILALTPFERFWASIDRLRHFCARFVAGKFEQRRIAAEGLRHDKHKRKTKGGQRIAF